MTMNQETKLMKRLYVLGIQEGLSVMAIIGVAVLMTYGAVSGIFVNHLAIAWILTGLEATAIICMSMVIGICEVERTGINKLLSDD